MRLKNTTQNYGAIAITMHWLVALAVIGLFALGWWMTGLSYYDDWYKQGPFIHKSLGMLLMFLMVARLVWKWVNVTPADEPNVPKWQNRIAHSVHHLLYVLLFALFASGYLISTADGRAIEVFGWFSIPATISDIPQQEDIAGVVHWYVALTLMTLVAIHALAALKHHLIDRDRTLKKMLGIDPK